MCSRVGRRGGAVTGITDAYIGKPITLSSWYAREAQRGHGSWFVSAPTSCSFRSVLPRRERVKWKKKEKKGTWESGRRYRGSFGGPTDDFLTRTQYVQKIGGMRKWSSKSCHAYTLWKPWKGHPGFPMQPVINYHCRIASTEI